MKVITAVAAVAFVGVLLMKVEEPNPAALGYKTNEWMRFKQSSTMMNIRYQHIWAPLHDAPGVWKRVPSRFVFDHDIGVDIEVSVRCGKIENGETCSMGVRKALPPPAPKPEDLWTTCLSGKRGRVQDCAREVPQYCPHQLAACGPCGDQPCDHPVWTNY